MKWIFLVIFYSGLVSNISQFGNSNENQLSISESVCYSNHDIEIKQLKYGRAKYGYSMWFDMTSGRVKAKYFVDKNNFNNVHQRYKKWKVEEDVYTCSSAGYVTGNNNLSKGLTFENGKVINQQVDFKMDGLVIIVDNKVNVFEVGKKFRLLGQTFELNNTYSRNRFLNWAKRKKATILQTHLLAYKNQLTISSKGNRKVATRKFFLVLSDKKGKKYNAIFYIQRGEILYDASKRIFNYLYSNQYRIDAMVNLDTGVNDILQVERPYNKCNNSQVEGRTELQNAINLLVFYK